MRAARQCRPSRPVMLRLTRLFLLSGLLVGLLPAATIALSASANRPAKKHPNRRNEKKDHPTPPQPRSKETRRQVQNDGPYDRRRESLDYGHDPLVSLNMNLDALAVSGAGDRAQELYQRIAALHADGYYPSQPDVVSFNSVLKAWQTQPNKALEFWEKVVQEERSIQPNVRSFNTFLASLAKAGLSQQAHELLICMKQPNAAVIPDRVTYNTVLGAYAVSPEVDSASLAESLLEEMIASEDTPSPDVVSFNTVLAAWASKGTPKAAERAAGWLERMPHPDVTSYTTVIGAWARCRRSDRAQALLERMQEAAAASKDGVELQPNRITYTVVMQALCQAQRPDEARKVLDAMFEQDRPDARPDCVAVSALMDGYLKANPSKAWKPVSALLRRMKEESSVGGGGGGDRSLTPNGRTYTTVLAALAQARLPDGPKRAVALLDEMVEADLPLLTVHFNAALAVCSKSPGRDKLQIAQTLWNRLESSSTTTSADVITYNTALATVASSMSSKDAWPWAQSLWTSLCQPQLHGSMIRPTSLTLLYWFQILSRVPDDNNAWKQQAVAVCCQAGVWNERVWRPAVAACGGENLRVWLQAAAKTDWTCPDPVTLQDLPAAWRRRALPDRSKKQR